MAREAVDFLGMGGNGDQDMAEGSAEGKDSASSPEREPERDKEQLPRSPARTPPNESEGPGDAETKSEEEKVELEAEGQGEAKKARTSPSRSSGVPSEKPEATAGFQVSEEEYRFLLQFRGMQQQQQQQAKLSQARQAAAQDRSARGSPTYSGGDAPSSMSSQSAAAFATSGPLSGSSIIDQQNRIVQARFAQAMQAESQHKQDSSPAHAYSSRPPVSAPPAALSLAIPAAANGQHVQGGFAQQGGFGSPIPGLQRVDGRHVTLSQEPSLSAFMTASQRALSQSNSILVPRSVSVQPMAPSRAIGNNAPGGKPTAQLTIFYSGQVNVYDDVPEDKARAIMLLAGNESTFSCMLQQPSGPIVAGKPAIVAPSGSAPSPSSSAGGTMSKSSQRPRIAPGISAELPQARKASLARFLEKRKDRARAKAPYLNNNSEKKFPPYDRPPSPPQNRSVVAHSSRPTSPSPPCASQSVPSSPVRQQLTCGEHFQQVHGSEDHGVSRMRCSGIEVAAGSDGLNGTSGLQPQLQQQQLQIH